LADLSENHWEKAAEAIMTTDIVAKGLSRQFEIDGKTVTVTGIAKGSGMIHPNMATMLGYVATDAAVPASLLQTMLKEISNVSFNRVTVDGDTSTNDSFILIAAGTSGVVVDSAHAAGYAALYAALREVAVFLAQALARDGEGATKFVTIDVSGGRDAEECLKVGKAIAHSPLIKTALFASDIRCRPQVMPPCTPLCARWRCSWRKPWRAMVRVQPNLSRLRFPVGVMPRNA